MAGSTTRPSSWRQTRGWFSHMRTSLQFSRCCITFSIPSLDRLRSTTGMQRLSSMCCIVCRMICATMLLEYYGKHIVQPRRDIFEKATGLRVTPGDQSSGFLTAVEADSAMEEARRQDLILHHASTPNPSQRGRGNQGRGNRGCGQQRGRGNRGRGNLRHLHPSGANAQQKSTPAAASPAAAAQAVDAPRQPASTSPQSKGPKGGGRGRGGGGKGK